MRENDITTQRQEDTEIFMVNKRKRILWITFIYILSTSSFNDIFIVLQFENYQVMFFQNSMVDFICVSARITVSLTVCFEDSGLAEKQVSAKKYSIRLLVNSVLFETISFNRKDIAFF